jgi:iron complex transport system substrate-binding protein
MISSPSTSLDPHSCDKAVQTTLIDEQHGAEREKREAEADPCPTEGAGCRRIANQWLKRPILRPRRIGARTACDCRQRRIDIDKILALKPDLVLTFSDLQADIAADLIRRGLDVHAFNQRSLAGILDMIRTVGAMVDASEQAQQLVGRLEARLAEIRQCAECLPRQPRVFFEEWDEPLISGIGWVSELVEIAGGIDIFADRAGRSAAKDRIVTIDEVVAREPDLIIGSWCGKKFRPEWVMARAGFDRTPAVRHQDVYEIKSSLILQPGPAALTDGLAKLQKIVWQWAGMT